MRKYKEDGTQEHRILALLRERQGMGVYAWEIMKDLNCLQYNARIWGLRRKGYTILNKENKFRLISEPEPFQQRIL